MQNIFYPLVLKPVIKDYIWGGNKLINEFKFDSDSPSAAEAWVLAAHKNGTNIVQNGVFKGSPLNEVLDLWAKQPTQSKAFSQSPFPLLIKIIDAAEKLSIQVHPNNEYALKHENELGKTEMWYVIDADEGATLVYGFNRDISKEEFRNRIINNTIEESLNFVKVNKGDVFFINPGTVHAIGKGIVIAEIQQNSNTTYRVSDYGRIGADGKPRELHVEKALEVAKTEKSAINNSHVTEEFDYGSVTELCDCEFFQAKLLKLAGKNNIDTDEDFLSILVIEGYITIKSSVETIKAKKGDSILFPAKFNFEIEGNADLILSKCKSE